LDIGRATDQKQKGENNNEERSRNNQ